MSLRSKVFLLFSALLAILLGSQWLMMRSITQDVSRELGQVAFSVGRDTASFFILGKYQWNDKILLESIVNSNTNVHVKSKIGQRNMHEQVIVDSANPKITQKHTQIFTYTAPTVEIRLNNQIKDDFLELITSSGTQSIPIPRDGMIKTVKMLESRMLTGTLIILVFGLIVAAYFSHRLSAPLRDLSSAAESVASGELGTTIDNKGSFISGEIKSTVESFNHMSLQLAEVEQLKSRIRENDHYKELGEISRGLAHSIRNPLNTLSLSVEELARNDLPEERRNKLVESASRQINRVDQWIRAFLTFSLSGDAEPSSIALLPLIQDIRLEASQLEQRNIHFQVNNGDDVTIEGVEAEVKAMLHALIINSVEASPDNGEIIINIADSEEMLTIEILDEGNGIPIEIRDKLFQPHQTTKAKGSGMGLYIAYRLATGRYNGNIKVQDRIKRGTSVSLDLAKNRISL
ncbi:MAG: HAMP domain-containing histidine kinase [Gammaproteobacteria bacterium]|nr:HAMP domain-containing histidine kinase [Gammaproteobacteria bacterium]